MRRQVRSYILLMGALLSVFFAIAQDEVMPADTVYSSGELTVSSELLTIDSIVPIHERGVRQDIVDNIRKDDDYWYANQPLPKSGSPRQRQESRSVIDLIFWILMAAGFIALVVWFVRSGNLMLFRRKPSGVATDDVVAGEDIHEIDFDKEIRAAVEGRDYRLAVRLMYLQILKQLADRNMIAYAADKTNSDYLAELAGHELYRKFFTITRHFDYVWYGQFPLTEQGFLRMQKEFEELKHQLS